MKKFNYEQPVVEIVTFTAQEAISVSVPDQDINDL